MDWLASGCLRGGEKAIASIDCVFPLFQNVVTSALIFAGAVALIFIIIAGLRLVLSGGDAKKIEQGRKTLIFAIVGLLVVFLSFAIIRVISMITGASCINEFGFSQCSTSEEREEMRQWGCFDLGERLACYPISEGNDPETPLRYYSTEASCRDGCGGSGN